MITDLIASVLIIIYTICNYPSLLSLLHFAINIIMNLK